MSAAAPAAAQSMAGLSAGRLPCRALGQQPAASGRLCNVLAGSSGMEDAKVTAGLWRAVLSLGRAD